MSYEHRQTVRVVSLPSSKLQYEVNGFVTSFLAVHLPSASPLKILNNVIGTKNTSTTFVELSLLVVPTDKNLNKVNSQLINFY